MSLSQRSWAIAGVGLTLAFFLSGIFVILTPLPFLYFLLQKKNEAWWEIALPCFVILFVFYLLALVPLSLFYQSHPNFAWILPVPGMSLLRFVSPEMVTFLGLLYYLFFMGIAFFVKEDLTTNQLGRHTLAGTLLFFFAGALIFSMTAYGGGSSPLEFLDHYYLSVLQEVLALKQKGGLNEEALLFVEKNISQISLSMALLTPALGGISIIFVAVVNLVIACKVFSPFVEKLKIIKLNEWTFSFAWVWGAIASLALVLANSYFFHSTLMFAVGANILLVLLFVYFLRGVAIVSFYLEKKNFGLFFRILTYAFLIMLIHAFLIPLSLFGFFDSWFDLRKLTKRS